LHTHLAETLDEDEHCLARFGARPLDLMQSWGWEASDVWFAHGVHFRDDEVRRLGAAGIGVAHCPSSNARLGAGMCRTVDLRAAGAPVGLGVDGVASNEGGRLFPELRQSLYTARLRAQRADVFLPADALDLATSGGARCLGRDDLGSVAVGQRADLAVWDAHDLADVPDAVVGLVLGPDRQVRDLLVGGERIVADGRLAHVDLRAARADLALRSKRLWPE
jgi:cytosine/adenosine deaminase-related metal-dependent hydrolase